MIYYFCLRSVSKEFAKDEMHKISSNGTAYDFTTDQSLIDCQNIIDIHEYLMKKHCCKN